MKIIDPENINLDEVTLEDLFEFIKSKEKTDDWRDLFQFIHNWGYNTDFTYNPITDPERHSVKEYLKEFIEGVYAEGDNV